MATKSSYSNATPFSPLTPGIPALWPYGGRYALIPHVYPVFPLHYGLVGGMPLAGHMSDASLNSNFQDFEPVDDHIYTSGSVYPSDESSYLCSLDDIFDLKAFERDFNEPRNNSDERLISGHEKNESELEDIPLSAVENADPSDYSAQPVGGGPGEDSDVAPQATQPSLSLAYDTAKKRKIFEEPHSAPSKRLCVTTPERFAVYSASPLSESGDATSFLPRMASDMDLCSRSTYEPCMPSSPEASASAFSEALSPSPYDPLSPTPPAGSIATFGRATFEPCPTISLPSPPALAKPVAACAHPSRVGADGLVSCPFAGCTSRFHTTQERDHVFDDHALSKGERVLCPIPNCVVKSKDGMLSKPSFMKHYKTIHMRLDYYHCSCCPEQDAMRADSLMRHVRRIHGYELDWGLEVPRAAVGRSQPRHRTSKFSRKVTRKAKKMTRA